MLLAGGSSPRLVSGSVILEKPVGWNGYNDLARLILYEGGERKHRAVAKPDEQAKKDQKSEQARHDQTPASVRASPPSDFRRGTTTFRNRWQDWPRGCRDYWYMEPWIRFGTIAWLTALFKSQPKTALNRQWSVRSAAAP